MEIGDLNQPLKKVPLITDETDLRSSSLTEMKLPVLEFCVSMLFKFLLHIKR